MVLYADSWSPDLRYYPTRRACGENEVQPKMITFSFDCTGQYQNIKPTSIFGYSKPSASPKIIHSVDHEPDDPGRSTTVPATVEAIAAESVQCPVLTCNFSSRSKFSLLGPNLW
ncbi:hypothetical protein PV04_03487 [Phialophora macrospora]|uniref:Uncharacterized protein n=1 Tax=Phialophora macrospora TaxID=1851006 RepID=A0A0D2D1E5_9EURO|nr:hypothetical protein PV04_03487 [Phialophora macrospora]